MYFFFAYFNALETHSDLQTHQSDKNEILFVFSSENIFIYLLD